MSQFFFTFYQQVKIWKTETEEKKNTQMQIESLKY